MSDRYQQNNVFGVVYSYSSPEKQNYTDCNNLDDELYIQLYDNAFVDILQHFEMYQQYRQAMSEHAEEYDDQEEYDADEYGEEDLDETSDGAEFYYT